jgi:hypothetical protein
LKRCGKNCRDVSSDPANCGSCEHACAPGQTCVSGQCTGGTTTQPVCGDGKAEGSEQCDGADLKGATCASLGLGGGTLACGSGCTYDTSGCAQQPVCGNGVKEGSEVCDGTNLGGQTCQSLGFQSGALACNANCQSFNTSACVAPCVVPGDCPQPSDQCQIAVCSSGNCSFGPKPAGTACDDGDACTQTDTCQSGTCVGGNPVVCTALDQCHDAGTCNPANGVCSNPNKANGSACSDGNACTQTDTCQNGTCVGDNPVICQPQSECHDAGTCNQATGQCSNPTKPNGTPCGTFVNSFCSNGICQCTPATQAQACLGGSLCGTRSDGCGGSYNCGTCPVGQTCQGNLCV